MSRIPVATVCGTDTVDQRVVASHLMVDLPEWAMTTVDLDVENELVTWAVYDASGQVDHEVLPLEHPCLSCLLRDVVLPRLVSLASLERWAGLVVVTPPGIEPFPLVLGLAGEGPCEQEVRRTLDPGAVISVVSGDDFCSAVFDDIALADVKGTCLPDDTRTVADAVVSQVESADVVVCTNDEPDESDRALLKHLCRPAAHVSWGSAELSSALVEGVRHDIEVTRDFLDPLQRTAPHEGAEGDIVTVELSTWKAMHPDRLLDHLETLGVGDMRGRGVFWLPGRPDRPIIWDSCGHHVALGCMSSWFDQPRGSRLVITTDAAQVVLVQHAFDDAVMTDAEMVHAQQNWSGRPDGFEDWLGERGEEIEVL